MLGDIVLGTVHELKENILRKVQCKETRMSCDELCMFTIW
jgi:hypothetical protein